MSDQIVLVKPSFNKNSYEQVINTQFTQLVQPVTSSVVTPTISVQQFFEYYQQLFYIIPKLGDINSHQYLAQTSLDYIGANTTTDDLTQSLLTEINALRQENLGLQQQILNITTSSSIA